MSWEEKLAIELPKVELHLHLDGSISPEFIARKASERNIMLPVPDPVNQLEMWLHQQKKTAAQRDPSNSVANGKNWKVFDFCNMFLQTTKELEEATSDLLQRLRKENVVYAEIRFCPKLHTLESLTSEEALRAVLNGFQNEAFREGTDRMYGGIIVCALRSMSESHGKEMAELAAKFLKTTDGLKSNKCCGVVGFDVAGDEGRFPLQTDDDPMAEGVKRAVSYGVPVTIHAGEWPTENGLNTLKNVTFAWRKLKANRIGHGIALRADENLEKTVGEMRELYSEQGEQNNPLTVEVCLTSNCGQAYKVSSYDCHPAALFYKYRLPFSLSCDNLLLSGNDKLRPSPTKEILHLARDVMNSKGKPELQDKERWDAVRFSLRSGIRAAFDPEVTPDVVQRFDLKVDEAFKKYGLCVD